MILELPVNKETRLKSVAIEDAQPLFDLVDGNRPHLRPWMSWVDATKSVDGIKIFIRSALDQMAKDGAPVCTVSHRGVLAGVCGFKPVNIPNKSCELGYWLAASITGRGIMTECVRTLINFAFKELKLNRVELRAATGNHRSRAIAERLGFSFEGTLRDSEWLNDHYADQAVYSVLMREWNSQHTVSGNRGKPGT